MAARLILAIMDARKKTSGRLAARYCIGASCGEASPGIVVRPAVFRG
jgi:hypothetical protein